MKIKDVELKFFVLRYNSNSHKIERYNILGWRYPEELAKAIKLKRNNIQTRDDLKEYLKRDFMYHYWSKAECEIAVGSLFSKSVDDLYKIDMWYQIEPNLDLITDYIINEMKIKLK